MPALEREHVPGGDVPHVDDVEPGRRDVPEITAAGDAADHPAGRRGAGVALADGRRRVDDDGAGRERERFRRELRPLVRDGQLPGGWGVLLGRGPVRNGAARPGRARVDDPADAGARRRLEDRFRPFYVHAREGGPVAAVVAVQRGRVQDGVAAAHRPLEPGAVEQVDVRVPDVSAVLAQRPYDVPADKTQPAAGDVDPNGPRLAALAARTQLRSGQPWPRPIRACGLRPRSGNLPGEKVRSTFDLRYTRAARGAP
jgi:hypothetical protein